MKTKLVILALAFSLAQAPAQTSVTVNANGDVQNTKPTNFPTGKLKVNGIAVVGGASGLATIPIGKRIYVDTTNGNNGTGQRGKLEFPFLTIAAAIAVAQSGDVISVGPGDFPSAPLVLPSGVSLVGQGMGVTRILATSSGGNTLSPGTGSYVADVTVNAVAFPGANPVGFIGLGFGIVPSSFVFERVEAIGVADSFHFATNDTTERYDGVMINCRGQSTYDTISLQGSPTTPSTLTLLNYTGYVPGDGTTPARGIFMSTVALATNTRLRMYAGEIVVSNSTSEETAAIVGGRTAEFYGCKLTATGPVAVDIKDSVGIKVYGGSGSGQDGKFVVDNGAIVTSYNGVFLAGQSTGFTASGGTSSKTLTVSSSATINDGIQTAPGAAMTNAATAPAQISTTQAGVNATVRASDATAGSATNGAAAGGSLTLQAGDAKRRNTGNANGGDVSIKGGVRIGSSGVRDGKIDLYTANVLRGGVDNLGQFWLVAGQRFYFGGTTDGAGSYAFENSGSMEFHTPALRLTGGANTDTWSPLYAGTNDASTGTVTNGVIVGHQTDATNVGTGFGIATLYRMQTDVTLPSTTHPDRDAVRTYAAWTSTTDTTRTSRYAVQLVNNASALADAFEVYNAFIRVPLASGDPFGAGDQPSVAEGYIYGNTTNHHLYYFNGSVWKQLDN